MADAAEQARKAVALTGLYSWNSSTSPLPGHSVRGYLTEIHDASTGGELQKIAALAQRTCVLPGSEPRLFLEHGLRAAISAGRMDSARYLMSLGAKVTNVPSPGNAALQSGNVEMFQLLVDNGWDVNSMEGLDGPVIARSVGHLPILHFLLKHGADPSLRCPEYRLLSCTALDSAAAFAPISTVQLLLDYGARLENCAPLHAAAGSLVSDEDRFPMLQFLLDLGLDINADDTAIHGYHGYGTALNAALSRNDLALGRVAFLLERGAEPNHRAFVQARHVDKDSVLKMLTEATHH